MELNELPDHATITFARNDIAIIVRLLSQQPYAIAAPIIENIVKTVEEQAKPNESTA